MFVAVVTRIGADIENGMCVVSAGQRVKTPPNGAFPFDGLVRFAANTATRVGPRWWWRSERNRLGLAKAAIHFTTRCTGIAYRVSCNRYTGDDYVDQDKIPTWNMDYVTAMLKGRPCEFALKGGNAQAGEWLATSVALPCARSMCPSDTRTRPPKFATLPCSSSCTPMRRQPAHAASPPRNLVTSTLRPPFPYTAPPTHRLTTPLVACCCAGPHRLTTPLVACCCAHAAVHMLVCRPADAPLRRPAPAAQQLLPDEAAGVHYSRDGGRRA